MTINLKMIDIALINEQVLKVSSKEAIYQTKLEINSNLTIK
jgi:hypothetical protein